MVHKEKLIQIFFQQRRGPELGGSKLAISRQMSVCQPVFLTEFYVGRSTNPTATEKKTCAIFYIFIGDKTVRINVNPMRLVQRRYSTECTRGIGFASVLTVSSPINTKV